MILSSPKYFKITLALIIVSIYMNANNVMQENITDSIYKYIYNNPSKAKKFSHKYLKDSNLANHQINIIKALTTLAIINNILSYPDSANYYHDKAIIKAYNIDNEKQILITKKAKANFLYQFNDYENALILFNEVLALAEKLNDKKQQSSIHINIGRLKYQVGEYDEALKIYKRNYTGLLSPGSKSVLNLSIIKTYLKLNSLDSAYVYIQKGIKYCTDNNDLELEVYFLNEYGNYLVTKEENFKADSILNNAIYKADIIKNFALKYSVMQTLAKLKEKEKKYNDAIQISLLIVKNEHKIVFPDGVLSDLYKLLAENYKQIDSFEKSNLYYQKHIIELTKKQNKKFNTLNDLHELDLKKVNKITDIYFKQKKNLSILAFILICVFIFYFIINRKKQKKNERRFNSLMKKIKLFEEKINNNESFIKKDSLNEIIDSKNDEIHENNTPDTQFVIKDEKVNEILEKLEKLEKKKQYLRKDFTLHYAAKKLKTNTAYLSKIVNNELGKSFSTYINELRIKFVVLELKNNSKLRAYSVSAIAEEIGYKRAEPFTKYFKAATGLTPAVYIKKINDLNNKKTS